MIEVDQLTFGYSQLPIFDNFCWHVAPGEAWAIIGPSGCGKTTLLYLLAGLRRAQGGTIAIAGQRVLRPRPATGLILQDYGLLPWATVWDNAALGLKIQGVNGTERAARVRHWLERLGIAQVHDYYPSQVSGGQRQRTAIARTLALKPDVLLMDEPFSSVDALTREDLENLVVELQRETGTTTVLVTHNIEEAVFIGQKILVLPYPPIQRGVVLDNPGAGAADYRGQPAFLEQCSAVREALVK